ncbi:hypothetical protein PV326_002086 [Microctonus aethiopoides]|nr:hypothetical protein PV326_002086 [Microctonus aethiopoides]
MSYRIYQCFILIMLISNYQVTSITFNAAIKFAVTILTGLKSELNSEKVEEHRLLILQRLNEQSKKLNSLTDHFDQQLDIVSYKIISVIPKFVMYNNAMAELRRYITRINELYSYYKIYENSTDYSKNELINYVDKLISYDVNDLQNTLDSMHELMTAHQTSTIAEPIINLLKELNANPIQTGNMDRCDRTVSPQQHMFYVFAKLITLETKGCLMTAYAYSVLSNFTKNTYEKELNLRITNSLYRLENYNNLFHTTIKDMKRDIFNCGANIQIRNKTYVELKGLAQGVIINTKELGDEKCTGQYNIESYKGGVCHGKLSNCQEIGKSITVCLSPKNSSRHYEWFKSDSNFQWGKTFECQGVIETFQPQVYKKNIVMGSLFTGYNFGYYTKFCEYLICKCCENQKNSTNVMRIFSLIPQMSEVEKNMVVIGVRFVMRNGVMNIQIKQGELLAQGAINQTNQSWVRLPDVDHKDTIFTGHHNKSKKYQRMGSKDPTMFLDDIMAPADHVVVGISFKKIKIVMPSKTIRPISLSIITNKFNWYTGQLLKNTKNEWLNSEISFKNNPNNSPDYKRPRTEINIHDPDNPVESPINFPDLKTNRFVTFRMSDLAKDAGQSTVPFFDAQEISGQPAFPLGGVGLFYKSSYGYGGFIAPKIFTVDIAECDENKETSFKKTLS